MWRLKILTNEAYGVRIWSIERCLQILAWIHAAVSRNLEFTDDRRTEDESSFSVQRIFIFTFQRSLLGDYTFGPLDVDEVETVTKTWKFTSFFPNFGTYIRENIQHKTLASMGVRQQTTGRLVGWMLENEDGSLGMLHVNPDHRGRGMGAVLIQRLSEEVLTQREAVYVDVEPGNIKPVNLYERCGYEIDSAQLTWIYCKP